VEGWPTINTFLPFGHLFGFFGALGAISWTLAALSRADRGGDE
jgi:hypothetical protein